MQQSTTAHMIFVFGSNLAGRHGKGAALWARKYRGAIYGQGSGLQGNAYGIPTKDRRLRVLPLEVIGGHVRDFLDFARRSPHMCFQVTPVGCGLAGYEPSQIAPFFECAPDNVSLPASFLAVLDRD